MGGYVRSLYRFFGVEKGKLGDRQAGSAGRRLLQKCL
jgi:hypothetical protein